MPFESDEEREGAPVTPGVASVAVPSFPSAIDEEARESAREHLARLIVSFAQFFDAVSAELECGPEGWGDADSNNVTPLTWPEGRNPSDATWDKQRRRQA